MYFSRISQQTSVGIALLFASPLGLSFVAERMYGCLRGREDTGMEHHWLHAPCCATHAMHMHDLMWNRKGLIGNL
jgi:hypothetical protein